MSYPLASLFHGDITIETGSDTALYGFGDLNVANNATILGSANGTSTSGALYIQNGGLSVNSNSYLKGMLTVNSTSSLQTTLIDTTLGVFSVFGGNSATISVGGAVSITSTSGNTSLISNQSTILQGGLNSVNAIQLLATNSAGGIDLLSGQAGQIALTSGAGGIQGLTSSGSINLTANNGTGSFVVNSSSGNQNLTLGVSGATDSGVIIQSSGTNATNQAITINTTGTGGNILLSNTSGTGGGAIISQAGSGGYIVQTNTGGSIQITANASSNNFIQVNSSSGNQNLTIGVNGNTNSQLILQSSGTTSGSIVVQNTNTGGSIQIIQPASSLGGINFSTGSAGLSAVTQIGGGINLVANGASSQFIVQSTANNQNLNIAVQGTTGSALILSSQGTGTSAIQLNATGHSSGISAVAAGSIQINSSDAVNGINIGTLIPGTPVSIGTALSSTTILGNLDVRGTTTTVESTIVQIKDNIIQVNSGPSSTADGGVAIKRYQPANNTAVGDVVADTPESTGTAQSGAAGQITLKAGDTAANDYYDGYWIKITAGTGTNQVRRIKAYNSTTKVATIYSTADQTGVLASPSPVEGLDWTTLPDNTSVYGLYPCEWIVAMWDSVNNEYAIICSNMVNTSATPPIAHYVDLHVHNINANAITATSINGATAEALVNFTLTDNSTTPVNVPVATNYGIYILLVRPTTATGTRPYAIFLLGRLNNASSGSVIRLISAKGTSNDQIDCQWPASNLPQIFYRPAPGGAGTTNYTVKVITV
jgi:hypothetical protein